MGGGRGGGIRAVGGGSFGGGGGAASCTPLTWRPEDGNLLGEGPLGFVTVAIGGVYLSRGKAG
jgi:hypothetical protein